MTGEFRAGDRVTWNSELEHVSVRIVKVHMKNSDYKDYVHRAIKDDPQHEIKSDKSGTSRCMEECLKPVRRENR